MPDQPPAKPHALPRFSQCPNRDCQAVFRCRDEVLEAAMGMVRCPYCKTVFNALANLVEFRPVNRPPAASIQQREVAAAGQALPETQPNASVSVHGIPAAGAEASSVAVSPQATTPTPQDAAVRPSADRTDRIASDTPATSTRVETAVDAHSIPLSTDDFLPMRASAAIALRNIVRHRRRTLLSLAPICFGVIALIVASGFIDFMKNETRERRIHSHLGHIQVVRAGYTDRGEADPYAFVLPAELDAVTYLKAHPDVVTVTPRLGFAGLASLGETTLSFLAEGVDPTTESALATNLEIVAGRDLADPGATEPRGAASQTPNAFQARGGTFAADADADAGPKVEGEAEARAEAEADVNAQAGARANADSDVDAELEALLSLGPDSGEDADLGAISDPMLGEAANRGAVSSQKLVGNAGLGAVSDPALDENAEPSAVSSPAGTEDSEADLDSLFLTDLDADPEIATDPGAARDAQRDDELRADEVILGVGLARNLNAQVGDRLVLLTKSGEGALSAVEVDVVGLFQTPIKAYDDTYLRTTMAVANRLTRTEGPHKWVVLLNRTEATDSVIEDLQSRFGTHGNGAGANTGATAASGTQAIQGEARVGPENSAVRNSDGPFGSGAVFATKPGALEFVSWFSLADFYRKTVVLFDAQVNVIRFMIALIIVASISNTMFMNVKERTSEIGTLMALGFRRKEVLGLFVREGMVLGLGGGLLGVALGFATAQAISAVGVPMPPPPGMGFGFIAEVRVTPVLLATAFAIGAGATVLASIYPARKAAALTIVDALRHSR